MKEKFNGFTFADIWLQSKEKTDLIPVNILYKPVKRENDVIKCFFTDDLKNVYRALYMRSSMRESLAKTLYECFYCREFWLRKCKWQNHIRVCGKKNRGRLQFSIKKHCDI